MHFCHIAASCLLTYTHSFLHSALYGSIRRLVPSRNSSTQGRIFIFGLLGYFKIGCPSGRFATTDVIQISTTPRAGLNGHEAPGLVTARPPKRFVQLRSISHALVSISQMHRSKLIRFGSLNFKDNWCLLLLLSQLF